MIGPKLQKWLLVAIMLVSVLGQFARFSSIVGLINIHEVLMALLVLINFFSNPKLWLQKIKTLPGILILLTISWFLTITAWNAIGFNSQSLLLIGWAYLLRTALYLVFAFALQILIERQQLQRSTIKTVLLIWLGIQAIIGLGQYLWFPDTRLLYYLGWDDHLSRAFGTLFDPGFFGLLMALGVIIASSQIIGLSKLKQVLLILFIWTTALSFSRASYLAAICGLLFLLIKTKQKKIITSILLLIGAIILAPKDGGGEGQKILRTQSLAERQEVTQKHLKNITWSNYLVGRGWYYEKALDLDQQSSEVVMASQHAQSVDNVFLHFLLSGGVAGLLLSISLIIILTKQGSDLFQASMIGVLTHSLFSPALLYPWILLVLALIWQIRYTKGKEIK